MSGTTQMNGDLDIDVASLFGSLWRKKGRLLTTALVITALAGVALFFISPKYKSEARILIEQGESIFTRPNGSTAEENRTAFDPEGVTSQIQLLTSADVLSQIVNDKDLAKSEEFKSYTELSLVEQLMTLVNRGPETQGNDRLIAKLREKLDVYRVENSRVIVVEFSSKDPALAAAVPNAIAKAYLDIQSSAKQSTDNKATKLLKATMDKLEVSLPLAEAAVAEYRSTNDILIGPNNSALATQQLSELSTELTRVRGVRANASSRAQSVESLLKNGASVDSVPEILSSGLMQRLRERQVQLKSEIADLSTTLLDGHPELKGLRSQLVDLDGQIRNEAAKVLASLKTEAATAAIREKELVSQLNGLKAESSRVGEDEVKLRELEREASTQRDQLESVKSRFREAQDRQVPDFQTADARVIQKAELPGEAYFPKYIPSLAATFVASLLLLSVITLLRELFSGRAFRAAAVPAQAYIPMVAANTNPVLVETNAPETKIVSTLEGPLSDREQDLVDEMSISAVAARLIDGGETCAIVVSPEGYDACASSVLLSRELSDQGLRVVLLDLTGNSAAARPMLDGLALPGITNLLTGEAAIAGIIHNDSYSDASVIPTGTADAAKAAKAVARLPMIINSLISAFDMVIVECGAATPAGLNRIVLPGSGLIISVINAQSKAALGSMTELIAAGYDDLSLVTPGTTSGKRPQSGRSAA